MAQGKGGNKMTREEHLQWCKDRALEYVEEGDLTQAFTSFQSDMRKHKETEDHSALQFMAIMVFGGQLATAHEMEKFINDFN